MADDSNFEMHVIELQSKFQYSFTALVFASLALCIQFSPPLGNCCPELLLMAWLFLFLSSMVAGYRLINDLVLMQLNLKKSDYYKEALIPKILPKI